MKTIIAGSRSFGSRPTDYRQMELAMESITWEVTEVVSGGARGADLAGEHWAHEKGIPVKRFAPDWKNLGKKAGIFRNQEMADYADVAVVFWDGESRGTKNTIEEMKSRGKYCKVVYIHGKLLGGKS